MSWDPWSYPTMSAEHHCVSGLCHVLSFKDLIASADIAMICDYGGLGGLGIRDDAAARPLYCKACGWYSAATSEAMAISKARVFCNDTISA